MVGGRSGDGTATVGGSLVSAAVGAGRPRSESKPASASSSSRAPGIPPDPSSGLTHPRLPVLATSISPAASSEGASLDAVLGGRRPNQSIVSSPE
jgi:hypothetical protein